MQLRDISSFVIHAVGSVSKAIGAGAFACLVIAQAQAATPTISDDDLYADDGRMLNYQPVPMARPDVAVSYGGVEVEIERPVMRPSVEDAFGTSTATLAEMVQKETMSLVTREASFQLKSGETLSKIL